MKTFSLNLMSLLVLGSALLFGGCGDSSTSGGAGGEGGAPGASVSFGGELGLGSIVFIDGFFDFEGDFLIEHSNWPFLEVSCAGISSRL